MLFASVFSQSITLQLMGAPEPLVTCLFVNPQRISAAHLSNFTVFAVLYFNLLLQPFVASFNMPSLKVLLFQSYLFGLHLQIRGSSWSSADRQDSALFLCVLERYCSL